MMASLGPESPLLSREPISRSTDAPPVVVVGLPRSGTSFLAEALSHVRGWWVFDDLYALRRADALGIGDDAPMTPGQVESFIDWLGWQARARILTGVFAVPALELGEVDAFDAAMRATWRGRPVRWPQLVREWMTRLARHHGRSHWGYKAPQDFLHWQRLERLWPGVRVIFIHRDPRDMMASLKFVRRGDGDPRQYHPLAYALYWRQAAEMMVAAGEALGGRLLEVRYDALRANLPGELARLARYLGSEPGEPMDVGRTNSSFAGQRKLLSPTETWLVERCIGAALTERGYAPSGLRGRLRDLPELARITGRFALHQARRTLFRPDARVAVGQYLAALSGRPRFFRPAGAGGGVR